MSVLMTLRVEGDGIAVEKLAAQNPSLFKDVVAKATELGVVSHRFYASDTEILVVDQWSSAEAFQRFFEDQGPQIRRIMDSAGVTSEPDIKFWHKLDTGDDVG